MAIQRLSVLFQEWLSQDPPPPRVSLGDILQLAGERSFGVFLAILAFPSALPLPAPGYSTPFGLFIVIVAVQWLVGAHTPWLPARIVNASVSWEQFQSLLKVGIPWLKRLERLTRPRFTVVVTQRVCHWLLGSLVVLMGISMIIPIPGTNTVPAMGVFLMGFGLIEEDGLVCVAGSLVALIGATLTTSILLALWFGGTNLLDWLKSLL
ncbi:MAG: exopolysaccharide biosynthesis protein [Synechococcales cyanobacterium]